ncbi:M57 family metalloprotease [Pontibacter vulgaris]|uniref:M57 family metalloprotease n=1 Tax=Pontibacter vulgaris TaxID=2905679 RepID=UPI001FA7AD35|nr:M57 family metalloprotease [Pontibacter vulgaris]
MKLTRLLFASAVMASFALVSCQKEEEATSQDAVNQKTIEQISQLGFNTNNVQRAEGGYIVEGDIFLSDSELSSTAKVNALRVGEAEQYRTTNLVQGLPRVITVSMSTSLPSSYLPALDEAIARYNAEGLQITFQRVASGGAIDIVAAPKSAQYLASAGFPTSAGDPHNQIKVATRYIGTAPNQAWFATILAHEMGHCIGFRHTDYMDRSYSCGGSYSNEGASTVGAILIPGTPSTQDPNSWMLACIGSGQSRPFNANDKTALNYLY